MDTLTRSQFGIALWVTARLGRILKAPSFMAKNGSEGKQVQLVLFPWYQTPLTESSSWKLTQTNQWAQLEPYHIVINPHCGQYFWTKDWEVSKSLHFRTTCVSNRPMHSGWQRGSQDSCLGSVAVARNSTRASSEEISALQALLRNRVQVCQRPQRSECSHSEPWLTMLPLGLTRTEWASQRPPPPPCCPFKFVPVEKTSKKPRRLGR